MLRALFLKKADVGVCQDFSNNVRRGITTYVLFSSQYMLYSVWKRNCGDATRRHPPRSVVSNASPSIKYSNLGVLRVYLEVLRVVATFKFCCRNTDRWWDIVATRHVSSFLQPTISSHRLSLSAHRRRRRTDQARAWRPEELGAQGVLSVPLKWVLY